MLSLAEGINHDRKMPSDNFINKTITVTYQDYTLIATYQEYTLIVTYLDYTLIVSQLSFMTTPIWFTLIVSQMSHVTCYANQEQTLIPDYANKCPTYPFPTNPVHAFYQWLLT